MISEDTGLKILPGWLAIVLKSMWRDRCLSVKVFVTGSLQRPHLGRRELYPVLLGVFEWL